MCFFYFLYGGFVDTRSGLGRHTPTHPHTCCGLARSSLLKDVRLRETKNESVFGLRREGGEGGALGIPALGAAVRLRATLHEQPHALARRPHEPLRPAAAASRETKQEGERREQREQRRQRNTQTRNRNAERRGVNTTSKRETRNEKRETRNEERGTRNEERGTRNVERGTRNEKRTREPHTVCVGGCGTGPSGLVKR